MLFMRACNLGLGLLDCTEIAATLNNILCTRFAELYSTAPLIILRELGLMFFTVMHVDNVRFSGLYCTARLIMLGSLDCTVLHV